MADAANRQVKVAWFVTIEDHVGYNLYALDILVDKVRKYGNRVTKVEQVVTEWFGSWDDSDRRFEYLSRVDITERVRRLLS